MTRTIPWTPDLDMRAVMIANAESIAGLDASVPHDRAIMLELLGPPPPGTRWPIDRAYGRGGMSTCAMVALGLLRRLGVDCPDISDGYGDDIGSGLDVAIRWARSLPGAWVTPGNDRLPRPGDVVQVLGPMHVLTAIAWERSGDGTDMLVSVDGGQVGAGGLQAIHRRTRPWRDGAGRPSLGGRLVDGWLDVDHLAYCGPVVVPESYAAR